MVIAIFIFSVVLTAVAFKLTDNKKDGVIAGTNEFWLNAGIAGAIVALLSFAAAIILAIVVSAEIGYNDKISVLQEQKQSEYIISTGKSNEIYAEIFRLQLKKSGLKPCKWWLYFG
jgi:hypothetical protein